jgi:hypothetical protein
MKKKFIPFTLFALLLTIGTLATAHMVNVTFAKLNCAEQKCTGGQGGQGGGAGGNFAIEDNTYTQSGGGGSSFLPGGGGGHLKSNSETGEFSRSGGNSDDGGGRCIGNSNTGELDCTGKD